MKRKNVDGDFEATPESLRRVRVELVAGHGAPNPIRISFVVAALDAERMGRVMISAAKKSRNKKALARAHRMARELFTIKPGDR